MADRAGWLIYGANGYTGRLVAAEARRRGLRPMLAGRRAVPIEMLAAELSLPARVFDLGDLRATAAALADMVVAAHCAGPSQMIDACLISRTHYLDITGEVDVFVATQRRHADAQVAGIVICPGVGFDVIPTDCLAAVLKEALPEASHLVLAFDARSHVSPGTARAMAESFRLGRRGGRVRRNGMIEEVPIAHRRRPIDFAGGSAMTVAIPGGSCHRVFLGRNSQHRDLCQHVACRSDRRRALNWARPLLASVPAQELLRRLADRSTGPSKEELRTERSRFWGEVSNAAGERRTARLETANGYCLTAEGTIMAVKFLLEHAPYGGYYTPSMLMGARCVENNCRLDRHPRGLAAAQGRTVRRGLDFLSG